MNPRSQHRTAILRRQTLERHGPTCWLCHQPINLELKWPHQYSYSVDHVVQVSDGGAPFDPTNARPSHLTCNIARGNNARRGRPTMPRTAYTW